MKTKPKSKEWAVAAKGKIRGCGLLFADAERIADRYYDPVQRRAFIIPDTGYRLGDKIDTDTKEKDWKKYLSKQFERQESTKRNIPEKPKNWANLPAKDRHKHVMPKKAKIRLAQAIWTQQNLNRFFRDNTVIADKTEWFITINVPSRKMTIADQIQLVVLPLSSDHRIWIDEKAKHLIIDSLTGYKG